MHIVLFCIDDDDSDVIVSPIALGQCLYRETHWKNMCVCLCRMNQTGQTITPTVPQSIKGVCVCCCVCCVLCVCVCVCVVCVCVCVCVVRVWTCCQTSELFISVFRLQSVWATGMDTCVKTNRSSDLFMSVVKGLW